MHIAVYGLANALVKKIKSSVLTWQRPILSSDISSISNAGSFLIVPSAPICMYTLPQTLTLQFYCVNKESGDGTLSRFQSSVLLWFTHLMSFLFLGGWDRIALFMGKQFGRAGQMPTVLLPSHRVPGNSYFHIRKVREGGWTQDLAIFQNAGKINLTAYSPPECWESE